MGKSADAPTVVLGVTGCIAAYKACELVRDLQRRDLRVKVVMTEAATRFVAPLTFRTLTGEPVAVSLWDDEPAARVHHISLAEEADVLCVAPCTANVIAKIAHGRADDMLTTTVLATEAPIVIAPAMNVHMWRDEATRSNVELLRSRGFIIVEPGIGELACGEVGEGRLAEVATIGEVVEREARCTQDLAGLRILVTAGPTYEPIDPVRFIGNRSSGKTGFAIAERAARRGAVVTLVTGPVSLPDPFGVTVVRVTTALEMRDAVLARLAQTDVVIAAAAVADFRPANFAGEKIKKDDAPRSIELERNPDILAEVGALNDGRMVLVGFAAETGDLLEHAHKKLRDKHLDLVVANDVSDGSAFGGSENRVVFVTHHGTEEMPTLPKWRIAEEILDRVRDAVQDRP